MSGYVYVVFLFRAHNIVSITDSDNLLLQSNNRYVLFYMFDSFWLYLPSYSLRLLDCELEFLKFKQVKAGLPCHTKHNPGSYALAMKYFAMATCKGGYITQPISADSPVAKI